MDVMESLEILWELNTPHKRCSQASSPAFLVVAAAGKSACGKRPKRRRIPSRAHPFVNEHPTNFTVTRSGICVACTHSPIHENARQHAGTSAGPEKRGQENPPRTDKTSTKFSERECDQTVKLLVLQIIHIGCVQILKNHPKIQIFHHIETLNIANNSCMEY